MPASWGPGWFTDAFDVTVSFDDDPPLLSDVGTGGDAEVFTDPWYAYNGSLNLFCGSDAVICGSVKLTTSNQRKVQHLGIKVTIQEYFHFMDPYVPARLKYVSETITQEDTVEGECIYPFRMPLSMLNKAAAAIEVPPFSDGNLGEYRNLAHWLNSYNGNSFAIRHMLTVEVYRPWYTFNLCRYKNLSFQLMGAIEKVKTSQEDPKAGEGVDNPLQQRTEDSAPSTRTVPETFYVDGLSCSGKCRVTLHSTHINLARSPLGYSRGGAAGDGAIIRGTFQLQHLEEPIVFAKCMLLRAEYVGSTCTHDALECEHVLFGVEMEGADDESPEEDGEESRHLRVPRSRGYLSREDEEDGVVEVGSSRVIDPVRRGTSIQFEICLDGSGRDNPMNDSTSSLAKESTDRDGVTHQMRIQNALWKNLAYQLHPTFYYLPLDLSEGETDDDTNDEKLAQNLKNHPVASPDVKAPSVACKAVAQSVASTGAISPHHHRRKIEAEISSVASDESVCLRYFLRVVVVEKSGKKLWETVESCDEVTVVPPYLQTIEVDEMAVNENV